MRLARGQQKTPLANKSGREGSAAEWNDISTSLQVGIEKIQYTSAKRTEISVDFEDATRLARSSPTILEAHPVTRISC